MNADVSDVSDMSDVSDAFKSFDVFDVFDVFDGPNRDENLTENPHFVRRIKSNIVELYGNEQSCSVRCSLLSSELN